MADAPTTFQNLYDDVVLECQELQGKTDFNLVIVKRMLNRAYKNFAKDVDLLSALFSFTTVANQQFYTSSDVANWAYAYHIIDVKYVTETTEFGKTLIPYPGGYDNLPRLKSYGEPTYYYTFGKQGTPLQKIGTYPIIDVASETLSVNAYHYPTNVLSATSDVPLIMDEYRDALVYWAVWRIFQRYSHLKREYSKKALESKAFYTEIIEQYKFNHFNPDQMPRVINAYEGFDNWIL